jgi:hypothetical protein
LPVHHAVSFPVDEPAMRAVLQAIQDERPA